MQLVTKRGPYMRVIAQGRQGRTIFEELEDVMPLPKIFEEAYPFEWPGQGVIEAAPTMLALEPAAEPEEEFVDLVTEQEPLDVEEVRPPTDDELVDFWADQARQAAAIEKKPKPRRGPDGKFLPKTD